MIEVDFLGEGPLGEVEPAALPPAPPVPLASNTMPRTRRLTLVEIEAASTAPVSTVEPDADALGGEAIGEDVLGGVPIPAPAVRPVTTVRASDLGYRSSAADAGGVQPYRPILTEGLAVNREMPLLPTQTAAGAAWGELRLLNSDRTLTAVAETFAPAGRRVTVRWGYKGWDDVREIETDPPLSALGVLFDGVGAAWNEGDRTLDVTLRDATWFAERALQSTLYGGTGGLEGPVALTGQPKPKLRGGTPASPVRDIEPTLVDPVALIYQINDARAVITALYESGDGTRIPFQANVSDLYTGTTNPGEYRTDQARGLFQLGREPAGRITVDAYGATLGDNFEANAPSLALALLYEDLGVPLERVEQSSFLTLAPAWPFPVGWYWRDAVPSGLDAVAALLSCCNAALVPRRDGRLAAVSLRLLPEPRAAGRASSSTFLGVLASDGETAILTEDGAEILLEENPFAAIGAAARYTDAELIEPGIVPVRLPEVLAPPPWRWRVGHTRCHTVQSTGLPDTLDAARVQFLAAEDRIAAWISADNLAAYPRGNDPAPVVSAHLSASGAQALVNALGAQWGVGRRLYDITLPMPLAMRHEVGESLFLVSQSAGFDAGRAAMIVAERIRTQDNTATLRVIA